MGATRPRVERAVVLHNPPGKNLAEKCEEELRDSGVAKYVVRHCTVPGGLEPNTELLKDKVKLEEGEAVLTVCGDGTYKDLAGGMAKLAVANSFITAVDGGSACDVRRAQHGLRRLPPSQILKHCVVVPAHMLECTVETPSGDTTTYLAASYSGWCRTGSAAREINIKKDSLHSKRSLAADIKIGWQTLTSTETFWFQPEGYDATESSSLLFVKGHAMAKYLWTPVEYWENRFLVAQTAPGRLNAAADFARLATNTLQGEYRAAEPYSFMTGSQVIVNFDGDDHHIPSLSQVTIGLTKETYNLGTTRLPG